jgi:hypothetical protein
MNKQDQQIEGTINKIIIQEHLRKMLNDNAPRLKKCILTDHGFVEAVVSKGVNDILIDIYAQGNQVDSIQMFMNENGHYSSFISYTVLNNI